MCPLGNPVPLITLRKSSVFNNILIVLFCFDLRVNLINDFVLYDKK